MKKFQEIFNEEITILTVYKADAFLRMSVQVFQSGIRLDYSPRELELLLRKIARGGSKKRVEVHILDS
ncbi:MAG: hypothetical protein JXI43_09930 [Tissierellales bacterium]|nr:hypothetical protein [Tissierellales bacterium]